MNKSEFLKSRIFIKLDTDGVKLIKEKYKHIYDEYDYDAEWQDTVDGVYIYDDAYYIFKHKDGINSTIICRENHISNDLSEIEFYLWEYVEFEYSVS